MRLFYLLFFFFLLNLFTWAGLRGINQVWLNVPPPPQDGKRLTGFLGDNEIAYRTLGYMLQNLGDHGGVTRNLDTYDYNALKTWFFIGNYYNQKSNYIPSIASFYFGGAKESYNLGATIDFAEIIGQYPYFGKWRFLTRSASMTNNVLKDSERAILQASLSAEINYPSKPGWIYRLAPNLTLRNGQNYKAFLLFKDLIKHDFDLLSHDTKMSVLETFCKDIKNLSLNEAICFISNSEM